MNFSFFSSRIARQTCIVSLSLLTFGVTNVCGDSPAPPELEPNPVLDRLQDALHILETYHLPFSPEEACRNVVQALIRSSDPNARIISNEEALRMEKATKGLIFDACLNLRMSNGMARISNVIQNGAADLAGAKVGDWLQTIGDQVISNTDIIQVTDMLRDQEVSTVPITVKRKDDDQPIELELTLQERQLEAVSEMRELPADLCYVRVNGMYPGCGETVAGKLREWANEGKFGIVLDLRRASGEDLDSVATIANLVAEPNTLLFSLHGSANEDVKAVQSETDKALGMPILVLVDERTSLASEVLVATLSGSGKGAIVVGNSTAGDPKIRERVRLAGEEWAYIATKQLVTADGMTYRGKKGVQPDVTVNIANKNYHEYVPNRPLLTDPRETTEEEREATRLKEAIRGDTALIRAVDVLLGLKALNIRGYGYAQSIGR